MRKYLPIAATLRIFVAAAMPEPCRPCPVRLRSQRGMSRRRNELAMWSLAAYRLDKPGLLPRLVDGGDNPDIVDASQYAAIRCGSS
jgi:hypothetical protein